MPMVDPTPTHHNHEDATADQKQDEVVTLTRSEEQLQVGVRTVGVRRLRIAKRVVTEEVTRTVTVRREELVVEELAVEPGTDAGHRVADRDLEIVLHEERVELRTVVVPVERVTVQVRRVAGSTTVDEELRREQIDLDSIDQAGPV